MATRIVGALGSIPRSTQIMTAGLLLTAAVVFAQAVSQWIDFHYFAMRLRALIPTITGACSEALASWLKQSLQPR